MGEGVRAAFGLAGGLALFLFGMESMSRALQQAAGERMRGFLRRVTRTPLTGALAGLLVTAVLQSSSATAVMVIGFVSAGLMELPQAVAVVFGANVGTTMTAQLVAFRLEDWVFPLLFVGVLVGRAGDPAQKAPQPLPRRLLQSPAHGRHAVQKQRQPTGQPKQTADPIFHVRSPFPVG